MPKIAIGELGVLALASEFGAGLLRTTLAAPPRRRMLLSAKIVLFTATTLLIGEAISPTRSYAFLRGQALLQPQHFGA